MTPDIPEHLKRYTVGTYRARNLIVLNWAAELQPAVVVELAGAVPQLAHWLLAGNTCVREYWWLEQDEDAIQYATIALHQDRRAKVAYMNADSEPSRALMAETLGRADVFICPSLEHFHQDLEVLRLLRSGTFVLATFPKFMDSGGNHVRYFTSENHVRERYSRQLDFAEVVHLPQGRKYVAKAVVR